MPSRFSSRTLDRQPDTRLAVALAMTLAAATTATAATAQALGDERLTADAPVLAIVKVPKPWYAPRFVVTGKMRDTMPQYAALPGLAFKAFSFAQADGAFGGLYLWKDAASARAWFSPAWFERVQRERGVTAQVRLMQVVAVVDTVPGGTPTDPDSPAVATLTPGTAGGTAAAPSPEALEAMRSADQRVPGLLRRYRVVDNEGRAGVLSLWRDATAARQQMDAAVQAASEWFDTPILLPSTLPANPPRLPGL
jgi:hypothetical protein